MVTSKSMQKKYRRRHRTKMDEVRRSHIIIKKFVSEDILNVFDTYARIKAMKNNTYNIATQERCTKYEPRVGHCIDIVGGDTFGESLLNNYCSIISNKVGKDLVPIISFYRIYGKDCKLDMHVDQPEYHWSATINMGYDAPECWPIYIEKEPVYLERGDCLLYEGAKYEHGRGVFKGEWQTQLFLHYREVEDEQRQEKNS
tara:strand:+ start:202 stop:801 length:600 start_codon:yes stop_codon:yes gene_type:complete